MLDIKKKLIEEIEKIDDQLILEQLTALIRDSDQTIEIEFSQEQKNKIRESQSQIEQGDFIDHQDMMKMLRND